MPEYRATYLREVVFPFTADNNLDAEIRLKAILKEVGKAKLLEVIRVDPEPLLKCPECEAAKALLDAKATVISVAEKP